MAEHLQKAIDSGNITLIKDLIGKYGNKILLEYSHWDVPRQENPLHRAINQNQTQVCLYLLQQKKISKLIKQQDFRGETPLHRCGWCGREEIAKALIKSGAPINIKNSLGLTPLHLAAERGKNNIIELLIANKADVNAKSNQGNTPLHRATTGGHKDLVITLVKANANPDIVNSKGTRAGGKYTKEELLQSHVTPNIIRNNRLNAVNNDKKKDIKSPVQYNIDQASLQGANKRFYEISPQYVVFGKKLGEGGFGTVYEGTVSGQPVALKQLTSSHARVNDNFRKELDVMVRLRHPNVVLLLGAIVQPDQLCLVTEICRGGSLTSLLKQRHLKLGEVVTIARHIAKAMSWLHSRNPPVLHLDLKPANILLTDIHTLHVKVADFGLARNADSDSRAIVGTRRFMAPEMMRKLPINESADIYSFGILLWQIYTRKKPFSSFKTLKSPQEKADFAEAVWSGYRPPISLNMPPFLAYLMTSCWRLDASKRPNFKQVIQWLDQIKLHDIFLDSSAQIFWDLVSSSSLNIECVKTSKFEDAFTNHIRSEIKDPSHKQSFDELRQLLCPDPKYKSFIRIEDFNNIVNIFGPFSPISKFIDNITTLINAEIPAYDSDDLYPIYHPHTKYHNALALLHNTPKGTFLLRDTSFNSPNQQLAPFTLSYVSDDNIIEHKQIYFDRDSRIYKIEMIQSKANEFLASFICNSKVTKYFGLQYSTYKKTYLD